MIKYTVEDYNKITSSDLNPTRWELIDGIFQLAPAPKSLHQELSGNIQWELNIYLRKNKKRCKIYDAPFDVHLAKDIIVQPDLSVICNLEKISERGCEGIPDLIVEILSPSNKENDLPGGFKFNVYQKYELKEYWVVDPLDKDNITLSQFILEDNTLTRKQVYKKSDVVISHIFSDLVISLNDVF